MMIFMSLRNWSPERPNSEMNINTAVDDSSSRHNPVASSNGLTTDSYEGQNLVYNFQIKTLHPLLMLRMTDSLSLKCMETQVKNLKPCLQFAALFIIALKRCIVSVFRGAMDFYSSMSKSRLQQQLYANVLFEQIGLNL